MNSPCPCCHQHTKEPGKYLCRTCWFGLSTTARNALNRSDSRAFSRLRELHAQIEAGVPLPEIQITA